MNEETQPNGDGKRQLELPGTEMPNRDAIGAALAVVFAPVHTIQDALARAQGNMPNPKIDQQAQQPGGRLHRFASLASVRNAAVPALAKEGIAITQDLVSDVDSVSVTTMLSRGDDKLVFGPFRMPVVRRDAHGIGSAATYAKRYHLQAVLCLAGEEDDDGNAAAGRENAPSPEPVEPKAKAKAKGPRPPTKAESQAAAVKVAMDLIESQTDVAGLTAIKPQLFPMQPACGNGWTDVVAAWSNRAAQLPKVSAEAAPATEEEKS